MRIGPERVLVTGAAGAVASALIPALRKNYCIFGVDRGAEPHGLGCDEWLTFDLRDHKRLENLVRDCSYVIHLATAVSEGWEGLQEIDVGVSRVILRCAASAPQIRRIVLASSSHVVGGIEQDWLAHGSIIEVPSIAEPVRPDSEYGVAKATIESYARYAAEHLGVRVSCLRIGTVRRIDDPECFLDEPDFAYIGPPVRIRERLKSTWLTHADLFAIVNEELISGDAFRLRYAYSRSSGGFWPKKVLVWNGA